MSGDGLSLSSLADHEELWQDGHRLQIDGESPEDLSEEQRRLEGPLLGTTHV